MLPISSDRIQVFGLAPRIADATESWRALRSTIRLADKYGMTGMLIFQGNDVFLEPWVTAQFLLANTDRLSPFVAVNPIYAHPFTVAKTIASLSELYRRRIFLNLITGTAKSYLESMDDTLDHDDRYLRLTEYVQILMALIEGSSCNFEGRFYRTKGLYLRSPSPPEHIPMCFLAGQSEAAQKTAATLGATSMHMLPPRVEALQGARGVNLGVITRPTDERAWHVAESIFPESRQGQRMLKFSMANTDSEWKRRLALAAEREAGADVGYWMQPFKNFQADNPYFVGSHERVATMIANCVDRGVRSFILDLPPEEEEFANARIAFSMADEMLRARSDADAVREGGDAAIVGT